MPLSLRATFCGRETAAFEATGNESGVCQPITGRSARDSASPWASASADKIPAGSTPKDTAQSPPAERCVQPASAVDKGGVETHHG